MPLVILMLSFVCLSSACATWKERRAAARTLAEVQQSLDQLPSCNAELLASTLTSLPADIPVGTFVTLRGNIRIGLREGRYADCLGNELTGCVPMTGPWVMLPSRGGAELFELYVRAGDETGWVSREGAVQTLTNRDLANVIVTGTMGAHVGAEERARGGRRAISYGTMCKVRP